ncbi:MAG TPA: hypothetical protein GX525_11995 [Bacilli bacterium]|nr:hypothetical protein [Bacilli bacterium]
MNINVSEGKNELSKRDHLTMVFHYGQLDRWATHEKGDIVINSDNADDIQQGQKVKLSEILFMKWMKLTTLVDRSVSRKENFHVKNKVATIAKMLGYSHTKGLYKILKPLFEVGLIDLKETTVNATKMIDIVVYPYPIYAESQICDLIKIRSWNDRESFGFSLSFAGVNARKKSQSENPDEQQEQKYTGEGTKVHKKMEQKYTSPVNKSTQAPVNKSTHTNIYKSTNNNKSTNINKSLIDRLDPKIRVSFIQFCEKQNIGECELNDLIDRLIDFIPTSSKFSSHEKYFAKTLQTIREEVRVQSKNTKNKRRGKNPLPSWIDDPVEDKPISEYEQQELDRLKREFEEMLAAQKGE